MIEQINKRMLAHLGHGTLHFCPDVTKTIFILCNSKRYVPVGDDYAEDTGKTTDEVDDNVIELRFDGENAIKSLDMIIEDLNTIKESLTKGGKNEI